jgi:hypothetical protein
MLERKLKKEIKKKLRKGEVIYYNWFSENQLIISNDWNTIREYNNIGDFPGWHRCVKYRVEDLDFKNLYKIIKLERKREVRVYIELL